jgi:lysophospholipase L1-like esterase
MKGLGCLALVVLLSAGLGGCSDPSEPGSSGSRGAAVRWIGRVDLSDPERPKFAWSGAGLVAAVEGPEIAVTLRSESGTDPVFYQPVVDGVVGERFSVSASEGDKTVTLGTGLDAGAHTVELYRETEGKLGFAYSTFLGFAAGTLGQAPRSADRLIEIVGDSISAGYGSLGSEEHPDYGPDPDGGCRFSTETESAYVTYGAVAARALGADASIIAASGWGISSDLSGNTENVLPAIFENAVGGQAVPAWDFSVRPAAVVINLGTNDFAADMNLVADAFTAPYAAFVATVREKYPDAFIYCAVGPMLYGTGLSNARTYITDLVASVNASGDSKVKSLDFGQQNGLLGTGCDWHPNESEHQRMAELLEAVLRADLGW